MRTTLAIDDDVLAAARAIAGHEKKTIGEVISDLARQSLARTDAPAEVRNGLLLLPRRTDGVVVTLEMVNALRDESP